MNRNWLYLILAILVVAWLSQLYWQGAPEHGEASSVIEPKVKSAKQKDVIEASTTNTATKRTQKEPSSPESTTKEPEISSSQEARNSEPQPLIEQLLESKRSNYKDIAGYPGLNELLFEEECGNWLDTDVERAVIDVNGLSGQGIFVSPHFCMASALWGRFVAINIVAKHRTQEQLLALQQAYDALMASINDKTERVLVTKLFVNQMASHYVLFPIEQRLGSDYFQLAALTLVPLKRGKMIYYRPTRFKLLNRLEIPLYYFQDVLENTLVEKDSEITKAYLSKIQAIFAEQQAQFGQSEG